jgi:lysophospholipase L1-like esterase
MSYRKKICILFVLLLLLAPILTAETPATVNPEINRQFDDYNWLHRHQRILQRVSAAEADLIFIGDSITHHFDRDGRGKKVWDEFYAPRNAVNMGFGWDKTENVLWRLDDGEISGICPKVAVVMIGTNNMSDDSAADIAAGIEAICGRLRQKTPTTRILLLGIFPRGEKPNPTREKISQVNSIISKFADDKMIHYMDIGSVFLEPDGSISREIMGDFLHPTPKGYRKWAEAIEPKMTELMSIKNTAAVPVAVGAGWWKLRHQQKLKEAAAAPDTKLIFIGDSITHNWERNGEVWNKYFGKYKPLNLGYSGDRTENVLWRFANGEIDGINPKLAVVMIGTNNTDSVNFPTANTGPEIAKGIIKVCQQIRRKLPNTKVLMLGIFPRGQTSKDPQRAIGIEANKIASQIADGKNIYYLDIGDSFMNSDRTITKIIMPDLLHLSPAGYWIWAKSIEPVIEKIISAN